jgi:hypothetical protein
MRTICRKPRGSAQFYATLRQCCAIACCVIACCGLQLQSGTAQAQTSEPGGPYPVGMKQTVYVDPADGRHLAFALFYPAAGDSSAAPYHMQFFH